jgi:hypothetical protein
MMKRGLQGIRALQGFLPLAAKHAPANVEAAAELALAHGVWHLLDLKSRLQNPAMQDQFEFPQQHLSIRELSQYQALVLDCFSVEHNPETKSS